MRQVLPSRLRQRVDALGISTARHSTEPQVDTGVLLTLSAAVRAGEELRFDYRSPGRQEDAEPRPPRRVQPHHLVVRAGRWYVLGWDRDRAVEALAVAPEWEAVRGAVLVEVIEHEPDGTLLGLRRDPHRTGDG